MNRRAAAIRTFGFRAGLTAARRQVAHQRFRRPFANLRQKLAQTPRPNPRLRGPTFQQVVKTGVTGEDFEDGHVEERLFDSPHRLALLQSCGSQVTYAERL